MKQGILTAAKNIKNDPSGAVTKAANHRQVYCVSKRRFFATATEEEVSGAGALVLSDGQEDKDNVHRIIQFQLR